MLMSLMMNSVRTDLQFMDTCSVSKFSVPPDNFCATITSFYTNVKRSFEAHIPQCGDSGMSFKEKCETKTVF